MRERERLLEDALKECLSLLEATAAVIFDVIPPQGVATMSKAAALLAVAQQRTAHEPPVEPVAWMSSINPGLVTTIRHGAEAANWVPLYRASQPPSPLQSAIDLIADDSYALTFQSMGQYRQALLGILRGKAKQQPPEEPLSIRDEALIDEAYSRHIGTACSRPPIGWHCTRTVGHDGPCAATPTKGEG